MPAEPYAPAVGARFDTELRRRSRTAVGWSFLRFLSDQVFAFVVFVLLARLLERADIGAFALMATFAEVVRIVSTAGLIQIVARERELTDAFRDTVYRCHVTFSIVGCLVILLLAHPFAALMDAPQIGTPLQVLALVLPIAALGQTHLALRLRAFGHRTTAVRSVLAGSIAGTAAVACALGGLGLWALVVQRLVAEVVSTILARFAYRWRPGRQFRWEILKRNLGLNGSLTASQLANIFTQRLPELVIGNVIGVAAVGVYRTAWRTVELVSSGAIQPFSSVATQTLARVKDDRTELRHAYQWMISKASAVSLPALIGFGALAPLAVPTVFGAKWAEAGELGQVFAFLALPLTLNLFASPSLGAVGASKAVAGVSLAHLALTALFVLAAAPYGLHAVAWAYVVRAYVGLPLQITLLRRAAGIDFKHTVAAVWQPLAAASVMGVFAHSALQWTAPLVPSDWLRLVLVAGSGALVYGLVLLAVSPRWRELCRRELRALSP